MKKIIFIANLSLNKVIIPNGVNVKNRHILKYLKGMKNIRVNIIDTENWKVRFIKLLFQIFLFSFTNNQILLSIETKSAYQIIKFLYLFKLDKKLIYFVIGGTMPYHMSEGTFNSKYYRNITKIYVETHKMENDLKKLGINNVERLSNSKYFNSIKVDENKKIKSPINCFYLGRIHPDKGMDMIFESFEKVNFKGIKFIIDFYGPVEKNYKECFLSKIHRYNFSKYKGTIDLMNSTKNYYILSQYDLFIFPTYWEGEGFPGVVIDSFISGVPVLASDWNHNSEIVEDGYNGIIFKAKSITDLIDKLNYIDGNKNKLVKMSKNAHKSSMNYKTENVLKVLDELI